MGKAKPQVIDDQEHERVNDRVAAVDVAKDAGVVCIWLALPGRNGDSQPCADPGVPQQGGDAVRRFHGRD